MDRRSYSLPLALGIFGLWLYAAEGAIETVNDPEAPRPTGYTQLAFEDEALGASNATVGSGPSATVPFVGPDLMALSFSASDPTRDSLPQGDLGMRAWLRGRGDLTVEDNCRRDHRWRWSQKPCPDPDSSPVPEASTWLAGGFALLGLALSAVKGRGKKARKRAG